MNTEHTDLFADDQEEPITLEPERDESLKGAYERMLAKRQASVTPERKPPKLRVLPRPEPKPTQRPLTRRERYAQLVIERDDVFDEFNDNMAYGTVDPIAEALDGLDLTEGTDPARRAVRRLLRVFCWDCHLWRDELDLDRLHAAVKAWASTQGEDGELVVARFKTAWQSTAVPEGVEPTAYAARVARHRPSGLMNDFVVEAAPTLTRVCRQLADATAHLELMLSDVKGPKQDRLPGWALNDKPTAALFHTNPRTLAVALAELVDRGVLKIAMGWQREEGKPARRRRFTAKRHRDAGWFKSSGD